MAKSTCSDTGQEGRGWLLDRKMESSEATTRGVLPPRDPHEPRSASTVRDTDDQCYGEWREPRDAVFDRNTERLETTRYVGWTWTTGEGL